MAADGVITAYLEIFGARVRSRSDRADLVDEVADHLYSAAERLEAVGVDRDTAERRALARFGDPRLVASLVTAVPSKGSIVSLFFSRHLPWLSALAALLWLAACIATYFGYTSLSGSWSTDRYLLSAVLVGLSCLVTVTVLIGLNLRAVGRADAVTAAIGAVGLVAACAATAMSWVVAVWLPLFAVAVTWTLVRARQAHAGSRVFTSVLSVAVPALAVASIVLSAVGQVADVGMEAGIWAVVAGLALVLVAALADIAVRLGRRIRASRAALV